MNTEDRLRRLEKFALQCILLNLSTTKHEEHWKHLHDMYKLRDKLENELADEER